MTVKNIARETREKREKISKRVLNSSTVESVRWLN
jgi:hypothetical protein